MTPWKQLASTTLIHDRWIHLTADRCELPSGHVADPFYVLHQPDFVHVFAENAAREILVVRQYRYAVADECVELPGGIIDAGEQPLAAARRELLEETGHVAQNWTYVGWMYASPLRQTSKIHLFRAQQLMAQQAQSLDDSEDIEFHFMPPAEIEKAMQTGQFTHVHHIASYYRAQAHSERRPAESRSTNRG